MYNSNNYWVERGKTEYDREHNRLLHQRIVWHKYFVDKIDKQLYKVFDTLDFKTVLEVGCGWGFTSKKLLARYSNIYAYLGIDISKEQLKHSLKYVNDIRFSSYEMDILKLYPAIDNTDLVFESTVFIHLSPSEIQKAVDNTFNMCRKYCVSWGWYDPSKLGATYGNPPYCFNHDYEKLYYSAGAKDVKVYPIKHLLGFLKNFHIPKISNLFVNTACLVVAYK